MGYDLPNTRLYPPQQALKNFKHVEKHFSDIQEVPYNIYLHICLYIYRSIYIYVCVCIYIYI